MGRCAASSSVAVPIPGCLYCAINSARRWAILGSASVRKIRTKLTSATRCCLRLRKRLCQRSAAGGLRVWFHHPGVQAINAWVLGENRGSSRLLEKQGFVRTQVLEKAYHLNGVDYDDWIYRLERKLIRRPQTPDEPIISANLSETAAGAGFSARQTAHPDALLLQFYPDAEK